MTIIHHPAIITITGPSGSGKTVLSDLLRNHGLEPLISTTTRSPRKGEIDGKDYNFITREQFFNDLKNEKFIENVDYNGVLYGVSVFEAERAFSLNKPAVLVAEPHGVEQIKKFAEQREWHVLRIFVDNPENVLLGRLLNRLLTDTTGISLSDNNLDCLSSWINKINHCSTSDLVNLLENFVIDISKSSLPSDSSKKINAAAQRLMSFQFEQANWVVPARNVPGLYEYITSSFNSSVQESVLQDILQRMMSLQTNSPILSRPPIKP